MSMRTSLITSLLRCTLNLVPRLNRTDYRNSFATRILLPEMPTRTNYLRAKPQLQIRDGCEKRILCSEESEEQQPIGPAHLEAAYRYVDIARP
jgi:hypothetical protein